jgi:hypothetical protein
MPDPNRTAVTDRNVNLCANRRSGRPLCMAVGSFQRFVIVHLRVVDRTGPAPGWRGLCGRLRLVQGYYPAACSLSRMAEITSMAGSDPDNGFGALAFDRVPGTRVATPPGTFIGGPFVPAASVRGHAAVARASRGPSACSRR